MLLRIVIALIAMAVLLRIGIVFLRGLARPMPEPPPPGEMRRVKLGYRCAICGAEVRMTHAATAEPEPPRHCMEDMDLVSRGDDD